MESVTVMLAGYSRPYPFRKESGEKIISAADKTKAAKDGRRKLAWLYSNGGPNQLKNTFYSSLETEVYPFEHFNKAAHDTRNLENIKLPGSDSPNKVPDEIICSMLQKIWFDLHPVMDRWEKICYKPLDTITEMTSANRVPPIPAAQPPPTLASAPAKVVTAPEDSVRSRKGRGRKFIRALRKIFRRLFGKEKK
ncbi:uncharacterized protein LOC135466065 [Liolophura sinensis]|uniref:uncharacterized protein LOC135466065 n=1 Tax=Liolophura sinensis TaxID=3198878 RepID=UPI003158B451